ncbi:protein of unknown function [Streptomyces sp. KY75]|nr:protein of unknown function [Streptomyces sp. KY75]
MVHASFAAGAASVLSTHPCVVTFPRTPSPCPP